MAAGWNVVLLGLVILQKQRTCLLQDQFITCYLWPYQVKECKNISKPSLLTGWLAGCVVNLVSNFLNHGKAEPCNEVGTFSERWQLLILGF